MAAFSFLTSVSVHGIDVLSLLLNSKESLRWDVVSKLGLPVVVSLLGHNEPVIQVQGKFSLFYNSNALSTKIYC